MVRASRSHRGGRWFESSFIHQILKKSRHLAGGYLKPLSRQHADAADFQSEYCLDGLRRSFHGCQPEHVFFVPVPVHFAYRRNEHVWFETLPAGVVHFTTMFWFFASLLPSSREDMTWYADEMPAVVNKITNADNNFFIYFPFLCFYYIRLRPKTQQE